MVYDIVSTRMNEQRNFEFRRPVNIKYNVVLLITRLYSENVHILYKSRFWRPRVIPVHKTYFYCADFLLNFRKIIAT